MATVEITLDSGVTIEADVEDWTTTKGSLTNNLTGFSWSHGGPRRLAYIKPESVAAVVFVQEEEESH